MTEENQTTNLHQYLNVDLIAVQREISSAKKLLQEMAALLAQPIINTVEERDSDISKDVYHCLLEREKIGNTGVGNGIALPHNRSELTDKAIIAIITLATPIDYDSRDKQPVDVAFGLLVPKQATQEQLNLLASIARIMTSSENKQALIAAKSAQQVVNLVQQWSQTTPASSSPAAGDKPD